jgi:predicted dehydrogenase
VKLFDEDAATLADVSDSLDRAEAVESYDRLLDDESVQIISIASRDGDHAKQVIRALRAGKHVFVEKPLARTEDDLRAINTELKKNRSLKLGSNFVLRAAPLFRWVRDEIKAGTFGEIYAFDGDYLFGRLNKIVDGWRGAEDEYSPLHGGAVHLADLFLWLTGQRPERVQGMFGKMLTGGTKYRYEDLASVQYQCESGLITRLTMHAGCAHRHQHVVRVFGTKATLVSDDAGVRLTRRSGKGLTEQELEIQSIERGQLPKSKGERIPEFVDAVLQDRDMSGSIQLTLDTISMLNAGREAMLSGDEVMISYLGEGR